MSKQTMDEVFAPIYARYKANVIEDTWGHLAPKKNKTYKGSIRYAVGCFGNDPLNPTPLQVEFELEDSPWFYDAIIDFIRDNKNEAGFVYEFTGTFRNYEFSGEIKRIS